MRPRKHKDIVLAQIVENNETSPETEMPMPTTPPVGGELVMLPEYAELYEQNNDLIGWICIEDTKINYPVMQSLDEPNFYLKHGFDKGYTDNQSRYGGNRIMFLYKDNRFHFSNISFCLPDNVYLNTTCEEYEDCIELHPVDEDFRIIIFGDYSEDGAKQFFAKGEDEACYRWISEMTTVTVGNLTGYSLSYKSAHNAYTEYHFDVRGEEANVLGFLFHGKTTLDMDETCRHPAVVALLQSLKNK